MNVQRCAVVAELAYAHDSGSCEHNARAGSSPANCIKDEKGAAALRFKNREAAAPFS